MLTMFAERSPAWGSLRAAQPAVPLPHASGLGKSQIPGIVSLAKSARNGERHDDPFAGEALGRPLSSLGSVGYEPSPYSDFNGARLLYFASFVSIADAAERCLAHQFGWSPKGSDWALV